MARYTMSTPAMPIKFTQRQQFIDELEARRPWAEARDAATTKRHKAEEKAHFDEFRAKCREMAKLSYEELKERQQEDSDRTKAAFRPPECPTSEVARLNDVLRTLRLSHQEAFTVDSDGMWRVAHYLLTHDENAHSKVC